MSPNTYPLYVQTVKTDMISTSYPYTVLSKRKTVFEHNMTTLFLQHPNLSQ